MGCKGSKKVSPFRYWGLRKKKNRVESLQGGTAFNLDIHPARSRLNRNISNRINIDEVFSDDFGGFNAGEIKYRSPTPIRAGIPGGMLDTTTTLPAPRMKKCNTDLITLTDSEPSMKTNTTWVAGQVLECEQKLQVHALDSPNDTSRMPQLHMCKEANEIDETQKTDGINSQDESFFKAPTPKRKRPKAAKGYRKAFLLTGPSLSDIPACKKRQDIHMEDYTIELDFENQALPYHPSTPKIIEDGDICPRENMHVENGSIDGISVISPGFLGALTDISEEHARTQIISSAAKGQRENVLFRRLSAPTLFHETGKQHECSGFWTESAHDLVLEDIEDWEDWDDLDV